MKSNYRPLGLIVLLILADQVLKIVIKTSFTLGQSLSVIGDWFQLAFVENPGMAFGMTIGSKYFLTGFRMVVAIMVFVYLWRMMRHGYKQGYMYVVALIFAGAIGNIIDCLFYGQLFSESTYTQVAEFMPQNGGYAPFMMGKVVDMFYFPLFHFPNWVPFLGGELFFSPVFNLADSYISVAVVILLLFYRHDFNNTLESYMNFRRKIKP